MYAIEDKFLTYVNILTIGCWKYDLLPTVWNLLIGCQVLGVDKNASERDIKKAFHKCAPLKPADSALRNLS